MGTVISNLKAKFGVDTGDFKKGLKDGEKAVGEFKGQAGEKIEELAGLFGVEMGSINNAIGSVSQSFSFFKQSLTAAASGSGKVTIALNALKVALMSTGIGALVVALGSLLAYFTKTGEGADKLAIGIAKIKSVIDNVVDRLGRVGSGLVKIFTGDFKQGFEEIRNSFAGIGEEIKTDWEGSGRLAEALDALEDREIALITVQSARKRTIAEMREQARDLDYTERERLSFLENAESAINAYYKDEIGLQEERYRIAKEQLAMQASDPTDEQLRELQEQLAAVNELYASQANEIKQLSRDRNSLVAIVEKENEAYALNLQMAEATVGAIGKISIPNLAPQLQGIVEPMARIKDELAEITLDLSNSINDAFENIASGLGEFMGDLANGEGGVKGFTAMVAGTFADMAISVGKLAISTGVATIGIKASLKSMNPYAAIAAGAALVALGTAVKGSLSRIADGGSSSASATTTTAYDTRGLNVTAKSQEETIKIEGVLTAKGSDLVYVLSRETGRKNKTT